MNPLATELAETELFKGVNATILNSVVANAEPFDLPVGDLLLSPAIHNESIFILLSGKLGLHFESLDSPEIRELAQGVSVGEMSLIDGMPPSAYVVAKETCRIFPIKRDLLQHLIEEASPVADNLLKLLTRWMRDSTLRIVQDRAQIWELTNQANVDALTRLYNRRWLDNAFPRLLEQATKGEQPLCVLLIDVDHFKKYNDSQGHLGGDQALISMGEVLKNTVRPYDFSTRYGGEEFLVLLLNSNQDEGIAAAERIRKNAEKKIISSAEGAALPSITISIGLAISNEQSTPQSLIATADANLYRAKESGRNCVKY
ncbi:MAG: GGDEF domain-containing protein [Gallionellaceae bacterium]